MLWTVCPFSNQLGGPPDCICLLKNSVALSLPLGLFLILSLLTISKQDRSSPPHHLSSRQLFLFPLLLHSVIWERWKQIFSIRGSRVACLLQAATLLLPPLRSSCRLVCLCHPHTSFPAQPGGSRKWWVTFTHFHPLYSAADLFAPASGVLIGREEFSLAGVNTFAQRGCIFCIWHLCSW